MASTNEATEALCAWMRPLLPLSSLPAVEENINPGTT
jgi:hypothetical protein